MSTRHLVDEILARAVSYVDRRGGAGIRRGGRGRGSSSKAARDRYLYALSGFTAANYFATQAGGGEAGDSNGFGIATMLVPTALGDGQIITSRYTTNVGWYQGMILQRLRWVVNTALLDRYLVASDLGRVMTIIGTYAAGTIKLWADRMLLGSVAATFTAHTGADTLGINTALTAPFTSGRIVARTAFRGTPSDAQIQAYFDAARGAGDLPTTMQGATITHKWPDKALLKSLTAPATIPDVVTNATADAMTKTGTPTVTTIDLTRDGRNTQGLVGFQSGYYASAPGAGLRGSASGFTIPIVLRLDSKPGTGSHCITETRDTTPSIAGVIVFWSGGSTGLEFTLAIGGVYTTAAYTIPDADVGLTQLIVLNATGSTISVWAKRGQQTSNIAYTGYVPPSTAAQVIGQRAGGLFPNTVVSLFGMADGNLTGGATGPEILAMFDEFERTGRVPSLPARATSVHTHDFHQDIAAAGGTAPATIADRTGTDALTRTGTGIGVAQRIERIYSYETSPILYRSTNHTLANGRWQSAAVPTAFGTASGGLWFAILFYLETQAVASATRYLGGLRNTGAGGGGFDVASTGTNTTLIVQFADGSGNTTNAPVAALTAADVGKIGLIVGQHDGTKIHTYLRRAEQGTGTSLTGYLAPTTGYAQLGGINIGGSAVGADGWSPIAMSMGSGALSLGEIQALYDATAALEDLALVPGRAQHRWRITPAVRANGGALPATVPEDGGSGGPALNQYAQPFTIAPHYARGFMW